MACLCQWKKDTLSLNLPFLLSNQILLVKTSARLSFPLSKKNVCEHEEKKRSTEAILFFQCLILTSSVHAIHRTCYDEKVPLSSSSSSIKFNTLCTYIHARDWFQGRRSAKLSSDR